MSLLLYILSAFFLGSIPFAYLIPKIFKGVDVRQYGSKNPGATNVRRVLGWKYGIPVLFLDVAKGMLSVYVARFFFEGISPIDLVQNEIIGGIFCALGHTFTPFLGFKGGKGAAVSLGIFMVIAPIPCTIALLIFLLTLKIVKIVSVSTLSAAFSMPVVYVMLSYYTNKFLSFSWSLLGVMLSIMVLIIVRHKSNIQRLMAGTEPKYEKAPILKKIPPKE